MFSKIEAENFLTRFLKIVLSFIKTFKSAENFVFVEFKSNERDEVIEEACLLITIKIEPQPTNLFLLNFRFSNNR